MAMKMTMSFKMISQGFPNAAVIIERSVHWAQCDLYAFSIYKTKFSVCAPLNLNLI